MPIGVDACLVNDSRSNGFRQQTAWLNPGQMHKRACRQANVAQLPTCREHPTTRGKLPAASVGQAFGGLCSCAQQVQQGTVKGRRAAAQLMLSPCNRGTCLNHPHIPSETLHARACLSIKSISCSAYNQCSPLQLVFNNLAASIQTHWAARRRSSTQNPSHDVVVAAAPLDAAVASSLTGDRQRDNSIPIRTHA